MRENHRRLRRGQITLFVIIGLALLLIIGLIITVPGQREPKTLKAQENAQQVQNFVEQCLQVVGEKSIRTIGNNGGYAVVQLKDAAGSQGYSKETQVVTIGTQKLPLWHEMQTPANGAITLSDHRPSLCAKSDKRCPIQYLDEPISIQENIEQLVEKDIDRCLSDFSSLPAVSVERKGTPEVRALIRDTDVLLEMEYPLLIITEDNQRVSLEDFTATEDVNLAQVYLLSAQIQEFERRSQFMEEVFIHLVSVYSGTNTPLPPFREVQLRGSQKTWVRSQVQGTIEQDLLPLMNLLQLVNARESYTPLQSTGLPDEYAPYADGVLKYMEIRMGDTSYPLGVRFEYPSTPMYLNINDKEYLKPRTVPAGWLLKLVGMNMRDYRFKYAASFPVVVHVSDPAAFNGRGYEFSFAMEANVRNNKPINILEPQATATFAPSTLDLSDESQRVNHLFKVTVTDNLNKTPVANARVVYACGAEYSLGETGADGIWTGKLPYCIEGGHLIIDADGYMNGITPLSNTREDGATTPVPVAVWPLREKNITVYKITAADLTTGGRTPLAKEDSLLLQFYRVKTTEYDQEIPSEVALQYGGSTVQDVVTRNLDDLKKEVEDAYKTGQLTKDDYDQVMASLNVTFDPQEQPSGIVHSQAVNLAPGRYAIDGTLMYNKQIEIPMKIEKDYTLPATNYSSWASGGIQIDATRPLELTPEFIYGDQNLVVFVLEQPIPRTWDDVLKVQDLAEYQRYGKLDAAWPKFE